MKYTFKYIQRRAYEKFEQLLKAINIISSSKSYDRFIIYSRSRSGSTMLVDYLNNHPQIKCKGELFQYLYKNIENQWESVWTLERSSVKSIGFKVFYNHPFNGNNNDLNEIIKNNHDIKIIHLIRRNLLEIVASQQLAEQTKAYIYSEKTQDKKVNIPVTKCKETFEYSQNGSKKIDNAFKGKNYTKVYYEDLTKEPKETLEKLFRFLQVPNVHVTTNIKKQNTLHMKEKIMNYEELKTHFSNTPFSDFFD